MLLVADNVTPTITNETEFFPFQSEVTALDVAKVFNHEDVIQELTSQMSSGRQRERQRTTMVSATAIDKIISLLQ